jgi:hypothetical protein
MTKIHIGLRLGDSTASQRVVRKQTKSLENHKLTFAFLEHLKTSANSGILLTVPSTRNLLGE